ncbi:MAG: hypothetical protein HKN47_13565 [Pirellulaceae bacterium]|nr:hypothetical protein [Pirellulaceae bacterium]
MRENTWPVNFALGIVGMTIGGVVGYYVFDFAMDQGFYALAVPGTLLGLGCGLFSRIHSRALGVICAVAALLLSIFIEWQLAPFIADDSFGYFVTHLHQCRTMTLIMIAIGTAAGFWFGMGRHSGPMQSVPADRDENSGSEN